MVEGLGHVYPVILMTDILKDSSAESPSNNAVRKKSRKTRKKNRHKRSATSPRNDTPRSNGVAPFPRTTFEEALVLGNAIQEHGGGQKVRRTTLFEKLDKSPDSSTSRSLVTNSGKYGITTGGYQAESLELTDDGMKATDPETGDKEKLRARFDLAIRKVPAFSHLYESLKGKRVPSPEVMRDSLADANIDDSHRKEAVDLFLENAKYLGLLRTTAGAERIAPVEQVLEGIPQETRNSFPVGDGNGTTRSAENGGAPISISYDNVCFVIAPIGSEGTEERKHSDMVLEALINRALEADKLTVIRADRIGDPGMITGQVINYLLRSKLVIADLSFHNPNVFYELAIRHMVGLPTVHLIRAEDSIPFDVKDFRTLVIDTYDKYDLIAKLDTYRAEIANHARMVSGSGTEGSNPIRTYARNLVVRVE